MQNIFTSEYKSWLFRRLHSTQESLVVQSIYLSQNDGNADIINFIDVSYVKIENYDIGVVLEYTGSHIHNRIKICKYISSNYLDNKAVFPCFGPFY